MRTFGLTLVVILTLIGGFTAATFSHQATAQDTAENRIAQLETIVADLSAQLADLDDRVTELEGSESGSGSSDSPTSASTPGEISITGIGDAATELIALEGVYTLDATCAEGFVFSIDGVNIDDPGEIVIIPLVGQPPFSGSTVMTFNGGRYAFSIRCSGEWTLNLTSLS